MIDMHGQNWGSVSRARLCEGGQRPKSTYCAVQLLSLPIPAKLLFLQVRIVGSICRVRGGRCAGHLHLGY